MLNRNAEALFWIGRYMERAENHARMIDVHYHLQHSLDLKDKEHKWARIIRSLGAEDEYSRQFDQYSELDVLSFVTLDRGYENSLFSCISKARGNLKTMREALPSELWETLNGFYLALSEKKPGDLQMETPNLFFRYIREKVETFQGIEHSVMLREAEWHFIESGRMLERAENTIRILRSVVTAINEDRALPYTYLLAALKSVGGYQAFRKFYADSMAIEPILEFLLTHTTFPRSFYYSFTKLEEHLQGIRQSGQPVSAGQEKAIRQAGKVRAELGCMTREDFALEQIELLIYFLTDACMTLGKLMANTFFRMEEASAS
ncbi:alpha-E domain-containing protein [Paenibacillus sp. YN15]|uniref:alpha-E domain-containing protein n=1 Tax=Paenibacillus sp. YN15 TaxID=1742774 RepID=UPI000DCD4865|nr:alpha-E domain-containing protein [Paenibacillus sp. YN15]RAV04619.1 alpha-E domain-containing protein [Paenibacillus sp. YN15]